METLFIYLLKSAGILTIFFLAYKLLLQKETFFSLNRHYLLGGIIASLLLPLVVFTSYVYVEPAIVQDMSFNDFPVTITENAAINTATPFNWDALLLNIYLLGVIILSTQFLIQLLSLYRIVKSGALKHHGSFKLVEISDAISPFSFFNYIIYNPDNFSQKDLDIILDHEKAHGKQLHTIDILASQLFLIFQWFNPIVWFYKKTIQQNLEFMADKKAISTMASKQNYQRTLLKVSVSSYCTSITNNFYNSLIKKRIVMLNQSSSKTRNLWKYSLILPVLALFLVSFNTKTLEIVKESEATLNAIPDSHDPQQPLNDIVIAPVENEETSAVPEKESQITINNVNAINDVIVKITKDTTKEELDLIEKDLREKGMEFSYSNLDYNSNREITGIKIKYKDKASNNSGSYHVNGDDDEPIKPIYIFTTKTGGLGIGSSPDGREYAEHMEVHKTQMKEHKERMYAHKQKMKEHNAKVKEEHEERMDEHRARIKEHTAKMEEEHDVRIKEMKERHEHMDEEREELREHVKERKERLEEKRQMHMKERKEHIRERKARLKEVREERKKKNNDSNVFVYSTDDDDSDDSNTFVIQSSTSSNPAKLAFSNGKKPLIIIDGKEAKDDDIEILDKDYIHSVNVLKGKSAIAQYGSKGEDGVVQITTKGNKDTYFAFNNTSEKMYFIEKTTSDNLLNSFKRNLQEQGIDFNYSGIKRNKKGEITRIKLRLNNNNGSKTSSTYDTSPDAIPTIMLGKKGSKLMISSSN